MVVTRIQTIVMVSMNVAKVALIQEIVQLSYDSMDKHVYHQQIIFANITHTYENITF